MIEIRTERPKNREYVSRLLEFCRQVLAICSDLDIAPLLTGSLAVFGYTRSPTLSVHDIDLACPELDFPRLGRALDAKGIHAEVKAWHVLQACKDDLKIEFDSLEHWMAGIPEEYDTLVIGGCAFTVVGLPGLKELYRRGLEATRSQSDESQRAKHAAIAEKLELLRSV